MTKCDSQCLLQSLLFSVIKSVKGRSVTVNDINRVERPLILYSLDPPGNLPYKSSQTSRSCSRLPFHLENSASPNYILRLPPLKPYHLEVHNHNYSQCLRPPTSAQAAMLSRTRHPPQHPSNSSPVTSTPQISTSLSPPTMVQQISLSSPAPCPKADAPIAASNSATWAA